MYIYRIISIGFSLQLGFFTYYTVAMGKVNPSGPVPIDSVFIYRPDKRLELWRFAFYMFLHAGWVLSSSPHEMHCLSHKFLSQFTVSWAFCSSQSPFCGTVGKFTQLTGIWVNIVTHNIITVEYVKYNDFYLENWSLLYTFLWSK